MMKHLYTVIALFFSVSLFAGQVQTVSCTVADLAGLYKWKHDSTYLSFPLNDVITMTGTEGNAKYCSDNTAKSMRYYQGCRKGEFAIIARAGVTIQSIKLTYIQQATNSVVTTDYGTDGKNIPSVNQVRNNEAFLVNANRIALYVGRSTNEKDGQVRITAIEVTYIINSDTQILQVTSQELANQYGWPDLTCPSTFDLNDAVSVDVDSAGTMKYTMNTKQMHCYQWLGGFTIRAKKGVVIKNVKLTYASINSGVMTKNWGTDGKEIPEADRIASGQVVAVDGSSVTFYVGTKSTNTDGQIRITKWEVEYTQPQTTNILTRKTIDLGKQYGWSDGTCPGHTSFNNALSFHSDETNQAKYYATTQSFHCYQWCGGFYLKARQGTLIQSVSLMYESIGDGVLIQNWGAEGKNIPEEDWIASGAIVPVNGDSVHFYAGNKKETENCQIHITGFSIVYKDTLAQLETFSKCSSSGSDEPVLVAGDQGYAAWQFSKFQRTSDDFVGSYQGTRLGYDGALSSDGELEGGVKDVSFDWRCASDNTVHFYVKAGETEDNYTRSNPGGTSYVMNYTKQIAVKRNCTFSVYMGSQEASAQTNPIIGPITITPYLFFKVPYHVDSIDTNQSTYDLKPLLINNTGEVPQYTIVSNTTGDPATITNGVVDLSAIAHAGDIQVKATCFGGDVSTHLTLHVEVAPRVYFAQTYMEVNINDAPFTNPLYVPDSVGVVTYTSSDTKVATINADGLVTVKGLGQTTITAHVAASEKYVATSCTYYLSVIYIPMEGTYRMETFSRCKKTKVSEGFMYVEGDDAVFDWNLTNYNRDQTTMIGDQQGIQLNYGGSLAANGEQEGGIKYFSFQWRATDPILPVHFLVNLPKTSMSYSSAAVGDAGMLFTYSSMVNRKHNTSVSINVRTKENPAQSPIVVGPLQIMPYLLFTNKYAEVPLPATSYDCASELINNTEGEGEIVYSILSNTTDTVTMEGSVLDLSAVTREGDIKVQAQWGEVSTTMTVHMGIPMGIEEVQDAQCTMQNGKVMKDGQLWIWRDGKWYSVLGVHDAQCTMNNEE